MRFIENAAGLQSQAALELSAFQDALTAAPPATLAVETQAMQYNALHCTALPCVRNLTNSISLRLQCSPQNSNLPCLFPPVSRLCACVRACVCVCVCVCVFVCLCLCG